MATSSLIMTLGKVIVATAWADGEITNEEVNSLKDLMFMLPGMTALEWAELEIYIETPVSDAERARLIEDLRRQIRGGDDRALVVKAINDLVNADGHISDEERAALNQIQAAIDSGTGLSADLGRLLRGPLRRRSEAVQRAPNREQFFEEYIKNKVYYDVRRRLDAGETDLDIPDDKLRKLSLAGGMMAQIARVNAGVSEAEFNTIVEVLQRDWGLNKPEALFVTQVAVSEQVARMDPFRLRREFMDSYGPEERETFLDVLFDVAAADGMATIDEIEEIRMIAQSLLLSHRQFIEAKLKVPQENRQA